MVKIYRTARVSMVGDKYVVESDFEIPNQDGPVVVEGDDLTQVKNRFNKRMEELGILPSTYDFSLKMQ